MAPSNRELLSLSGKMLIAALSLVLSAGAVSAEPATETSEALALKTIMQDLSKNMQVITEAVSREDWQRVEEIAPLIADHPQPPFTEKMRIMAFIGTDASKFKAFDGVTHDTAGTMGEAAARGDGYAVIEEFFTLQNSCLACHETFRKPFQEHFYGKN